MTEERPWLEFYPEGVPANINPPEKSLPELFDEACERFPDSIALVFEGRGIKYEELRELTDRFAAAMSDLGLKKGDRVGLYLPNSPQFIIAYLGAMKAGGVISPMNPMYVSREIKHQLKDCGANSIVCLDTLYETIERSGLDLENVVVTNIGEYLPTLKRVVGKVFGGIHKKLYIPSSEVPDDVHKFQDLIENYPPDPPEIKFDPENDLAVLPYTGGTTGLPKGSMLTHQNVAVNSKQMKVFSTYVEEGKEVSVAYLPLYHIYGQTVTIFFGLTTGQTLLLFTTPDLDDILDAMEKYEVTIFFGVPTIYNMLRDFDKTQRVNWKRLKIITSAADALHKSTREDWEDLTGTKLTEGYGLTEASPTTHFNPYGKERMGSLGVPIPSTMAAIVDPDGKEFLPPGEIGEIIVHGPQVMKGYWKKPEITEKTIVKIDGKKWLRTGDLGWMDEDGYFHFKDRKKDWVKYKGYSVYTSEVEEVLTNHPKIKEAGVIGVPKSEVGEVVKAVVVLETDARGEISEDEIIDYCEKNLAHYKVPKVVEFRGEIPKTDVGKVSHRELREELGER